MMMNICDRLQAIVETVIINSNYRPIDTLNIVCASLPRPFLYNLPHIIVSTRYNNGCVIYHRCDVGRQQQMRLLFTCESRAVLT